MDDQRERMVFWALVGGLLVATGAAYVLILGAPPGEREPVVLFAEAPPAARAAPARAAPPPATQGARVGPGAAAASVTPAAAAPETAPASRTGDVASAEPPGAAAPSGRPDSPAPASPPDHEVAAPADGGDVAAEGRRGASDDRPPAAPAQGPPPLVLTVDWPAERTTNHARLRVTGRTTPGATVEIGAERVKVEPDGRFSHVLVLHEGEQRLAARARADGGLEAIVDGPVVVLDTRAPEARFETGDLWGKP